VVLITGSSITGAYVFSIAVYITVTIPALRTIVTPVEDVDTREDRIEAMRLLSAGNVIIIFGLAGILLLQVCCIETFLIRNNPPVTCNRQAKNMRDGRRPRHWPRLQKKRRGRQLPLRKKINDTS
jgi:hypothetical protein